jgi:hypothetical protein
MTVSPCTDHVSGSPRAGPTAGWALGISAQRRRQGGPIRVRGAWRQYDWRPAVVATAACAARHRYRRPCRATCIDCDAHLLARTPGVYGPWGHRIYRRSDGRWCGTETFASPQSIWSMARPLDNAVTRSLAAVPAVSLMAEPALMRAQLWWGRSITMGAALARGSVAGLRSRRRQPAIAADA